LNEEPLVSIDFTGTDYSAIIDVRWFEVINGNLIKMTLWYDNEFGYSRRVVDLSRFLFGLKPQIHLYEKNSLS
jgi:glyceraldehyde-3-phosphate dehydrogenase/erythrose-4-phosphate dehydrogenase